MKAYWVKKSAFITFSDFYLSFIFNLLGNSLQLRSYITSMISAWASYDSVTFFQDLGAVMQIMYSTVSYKTAASSLMGYMVYASQESNEIKGIEPKEVRESRLLEESHKMRELVKTMEPKHVLKKGEGYNWTFSSFI